MDQEPFPAEIPGRLKALFAAFREADLRWALLRPWEGLCSTEGDIDILLESVEFDRARDILVRARFVIIPMGGADLHAATFDPSADRFFWIHLQSALKIGDAIFPAQKLLEIVPNAAPPELPSEWLLWTLLLRAVDKGGVPERYRTRLMHLARDWRGGPAELVAAAQQRGLDPQGTVAAAGAGDWPQIAAHRAGDEEPTSSHKRAAGRIRRLLSVLTQPKPYGLCVAVIGPDGAGKSTLVRELERTLPLRTRQTYMGLTSGAMQEATRLRIPGLVFAAQAAALWTKFIRARLYRAAGQIVLFDRYVLDGAVPPGRPLPRRMLLARRVQRWLVPSPDLVLFLDVSGQTMYARKGAYSAETLEEWRRIYRRMEGTVRGLVVVDAEQPPEVVLRTAQALIWEKVRERLRQ